MQNVMERYQTFRQVVDDIMLMNNRFMNKVFDGNIPATQRMLRGILKNDKIKVRKVSVQQWLQNLYGHSTQLDILAEDENGTQFNCSNPANMHYKELADRVNYFKTSKEGEIDMTDIIEAYANNKAKEAAEKAAKKMLADGMSLEAVVRYSELSEEEVRALAAKQSA